MDKTIVVGIGGTGLDAIRELRKLIVERGRSLENLPNLGFLYLDTDSSGVDQARDVRTKWQLLGKSFELKASEYRILKTASIGSVLGDLDNFPRIKNWLPAEGLRSLDQTAKDTPGASQIRPLGRYIFTMKVDEVKSSFISVLNRTKQAEGGGDNVVYL